MPKRHHSIQRNRITADELLCNVHEAEVWRAVENQSQYLLQTRTTTTVFLLQVSLSCHNYDRLHECDSFAFGIYVHKTRLYAYKLHEWLSHTTQDD